MKKMYSEELANVVKEALDDYELHYSFDTNRGIFQHSMGIKSVIQRVDIYIDVHDDKILFYGVCPIGADAADNEMMSSMGEFLHAATRGLIEGNFEFDYRDGEIRYKVLIKCESHIPSHDDIISALACITAMYMKYARGIVGIICAKGDPKKLIKICEGREDDTEEIEEDNDENGCTDFERRKIIHTLFEHIWDPEEDEDGTEETEDNYETINIEDIDPDNMFGTETDESDESGDIK